MSNNSTAVWVLGDQLLDQHPAIEATLAQTEDPRQVRVVMVENMRRAARLPYHKKKLILIFSAMRHYAERLRAHGLTVDYLKAETLSGALHAYASQHRPARWVTMAASEYHGRRYQSQRLHVVTGVPVEVLPNTQFLIGRYDPNPNPDPRKQYVMETFYRAMRRHFDLLMDDDQPAGGEWNYDRENRKPLPKSGLDFPAPPRFEPDEMTRGVIEEVAALPGTTGSTADFEYAVTHEQAAQALDDFIERRLALFGPYEDAMTAHDRVLFHSVLSPYLNLGLLEPLATARAAETAYREGRAPLNSVEGFIRQIIGWREFIAWQYWRAMPALAEQNAWSAARSLPGFFWHGQTDMHCLRCAIGGALSTGYAHHIERLMLISNFCLLAGVEPQAVVDWFSAVFIDAYDWVMQPNVIGMGLNADGGRIATKPYIASANYINKMSDYCASCRYDPKARTGERACPFNFLYWNFLIDHEAKLRRNPRLGQNVLGLRHLDDDQRKAVQTQAASFLDALANDPTGAS
ncbi:MAG: cryptochrome/photolyase family protein [Aggregatilineales bacterium]